MNKSEQILELFKDLMHEDREEALSISAGLFVGAYVSHLESEGHVVNKDIKINGGIGQRNITIHALN
ncbi:hypothetical protein [Pseudoalteromonas phenolica]|uniref:hypothetical protein n=1 Tax=Pseudoalteromonas phenolica TaxID=161398 RepID=UPI00384E6663